MHVYIIPIIRAIIPLNCSIICYICTYIYKRVTHAAYHTSLVTKVTERARAHTLLFRYIPGKKKNPCTFECPGTSAAPNYRALFNKTAAERARARKENFDKVSLSLLLSAIAQVFEFPAAATSLIHNLRLTLYRLEYIAATR